MLVRVLASQLEQFRPLLDEAARANGITDEMMPRIIRSLVDGSAQLWVEQDEEGHHRGIVMTVFTEDDIEGVRSLLIYAIYRKEFVSAQDWREGMLTLARFALANRCDRLVARAATKAVASLALSLGWRVGGVLVEYPLDGGKR